MRRPHRGYRRPTAAIAGLLLAVVAGCARPVADAAVDPQDSVPATSAQPRVQQPGPPRVGHPARSQRIRFEPESVTLPGGATASVELAQTADGMLQVPENVQHVGWWDGSAYAGDPFGSTVIAGHVDSATQGIGYFARLLRVNVGELVTLRGDGHSARYRVTSVQLVARQALASDSVAFDQAGAHRLVLITCGGTFHRDRGGYDSNLVVIARPVGSPR